MMISRTVRNVMTREVVTVNEQAPFTELVRLMAVHKLSALPVVDGDGQVVGIVSRADLLRLFLRDDEAIHREILDEVLLRALWIDPAAVLVTVRDGLVTLVGHLERKSMVQMAVHLTRTVPGVVDVVSQLTFALDDDRLEMPRSRSFLP